MDYFAANDIAAFTALSGLPSESVTAGHFDATYVAKCIACTSSSGDKLQSAVFIDADTGATTDLTDFWMHFELFNFTASGGTATILELLNSAGTPVLRLLAVNSVANNAIRLEYWNGAAWVAGAVTTMFGGDQQKHALDLHVVTGVGGSVKIYGDQSLSATQTGLNAAVTNVRSFTLGHGGYSNGAHFSQFLVSDTSTVGAKVAALVPNSNSATNTAWSNDYTKIVETGYDDVTLINSAVTGDKEGYGATDATLPSSYVISSMWFAARAKLGGAAPVNLKPLLRIGGVDYAGAYNMPNLSAAAFAAGMAAFRLDPSTAAAWAIANVNAAELGFQSAA